MNRVIETSSRLLELLTLLQGRREWPGNELAERLEVSGRTIRRDIDRLRRLGYPVDSLSGPSGGYRLRAGTAMPPLLLDDEEAIAIAVGLRTAARASVTGIEETAVRALLKLEQVLPSHLRRRVGALGSATVTPPDRAGRPSIPSTSLCSPPPAATASCVRFAYRRRDGTASRREVEPHSLVNHGRRWYLLAWDRRREDWRTFRLDRLDEARGHGRALSRASAAGEGRSRLRRPEHHQRAEPLRSGRHAAGDVRVRQGAGARRTGARSSRGTATAAASGPATTTSTGSPCGSR